MHMFAAQVRLVNNSTLPGSQYEGRVEVYNNGEWATVCAHDWTYEDAEVVCRMAAFAVAVRPVTGGYYGQGEFSHLTLQLHVDGWCIYIVDN